MLAVLISGYADLADWLYLIAAVLFAVAGLNALFARPEPTAAAPTGRPLGWVPAIVADGLVSIGLALLAIAWLVL
jgi:hypothetical protein